MLFRVKTTQSGSIIVSLLIITIVLSGFVYGLLSLSNATIARSRQRVFVLQAQYAAESGADSAITKLNQDETYPGTSGEITLLDGERYRATYDVSVSAGATSKQRVVTATGSVYVPANASNASYTRTIEVTAEQSSDTTSSGLLSRNIMHFQSGVKSVAATDVFVNEYIFIQRNTTDLVAENITVAGRDTGPGNCSIEGMGNLVKPDSFSDPAQTKVNIRTAYNNCITPPGNSDTSDFTVSANESNISKVQSTYIPWSFILDSGYGAAGSCADWEVANTTVDIPSAGNDGLTHYPDDGDGVASSCGDDGSLDLGDKEYNLTDHVHIRADLCADGGCEPIFNNPDTGEDSVKYVFVEGWINFNQLTSAPGSGPIVFVSYGTDPASKTKRCPLGGSIFLGNSGNTSAPAIFLLATNGACLDRTRFGSEPALGGISGKNIYISTNPGTPFDLEIDPSFPVDEIPIDLSWRAVRYKSI